MGWKPGDPPRASGGRRRKTVVPEPPPSNVTPITDAPSAPRRRRRLSSQSSASETEAPQVGGSGVEPGGRQETRQPRKKVRLGERWSDIVKAVEAGEYTWQQFVESLDDEEVGRCQLKSADGGFTGRPPSFVPREFALAAGRELKRRFDEIFKKDVTGIAREYVRLAQDKSIPAKDRAKMMQYAMERIMGGIPKEIFFTQEQPWETVVTTIVANEEQTGAPVDRYAGRATERDTDT